MEGVLWLFRFSNRHLLSIGSRRMDDSLFLQATIKQSSFGIREVVIAFTRLMNTEGECQLSGICNKDKRYSHPG